MGKIRFKNLFELVLSKYIKPICIIIVCILCVIIINHSKKICGNFIELPYTNMPSKYETYKLNDGNILILGENMYEKINKSKNRAKYNFKIKQEPSYIYDVQNKNFKYYQAPQDIAYRPYGIKFDNDKILLIYAYDQNNKKYVSNLVADNVIKPPYPYDSMAILNVKTGKIEKIIQKKISLKYKPDFEDSIKQENNLSYVLLENGKIVLIDFKNKTLEIYNPKTYKSDIIDFKISKTVGSKAIAVKNKIFIFGPNFTNNDITSDNKSDILEYNIENKSIKAVGKSLTRRNPILLKRDDDSIIILGGELVTNHIYSSNVKEIEEYNVNTNTTEIIAKMTKERRFDWERNETSFGTVLINSNLLMIIGGITGAAPWIRHEKTGEIIDFKTHKTFCNFNLPFKIDNANTIKIDDGNVLILPKTQQPILFNFKKCRGENNEQ